MEIRTKISLVNQEGEPFMGPGLLKLLRRIDQHKSINKAAGEMKLSYVKALNLLNRLEKDLGETILVRTRGGNTKGGTELTARGKRFIDEYDRLEQEVRKRSDAAFNTFCKRLEKRSNDDNAP